MYRKMTRYPAWITALLFPMMVHAQPVNQSDIDRWEKQSKQVNIIRDNWGIPHVYGHTNADAVFGLMYAQCQDDFPRIEMNYVEKLGRRSEVLGEKELYNDLLIRLVIDSAGAMRDYQKAEPWLRALLDAFADGINFYLYKHPSVKPALLTRFQPWYPLLWTDGSIGAINTAGLTTNDIREFYGGEQKIARIDAPAFKIEESGSNGFAIAPSRTASGNSILYMNPHVTYYFRPEVQMVSDEGLNVYGAVTWGQFFVYQGFNEHCGWMHTSNNVDVADLYTEKIRKRNGVRYRYNNAWKKIGRNPVTIRYRTDQGSSTKTFDTYFTPHGPVMTSRGDDWLSMKAVNRSMTGLIQSWKRTLAKNYSEFRGVMALRSNMSNNTVYADAQRNIAYWHGNFVPVRDTSLDWAKPVDGTTAATAWKGLHTVDQTIQVFNPASGWIQNCNSTAFTCCGVSSPKKESYPVYMGPEGENFRGLNAARLLDQAQNMTPEKMIALGYDTHLTTFDVILPALFKAADQQHADSTIDTLKAPIDILRQWNRASSDTSVATTIAIAFGERLSADMYRRAQFSQSFDPVLFTKAYCDSVSSEVILGLLRQGLSDLNEKYGTWNIKWGEINRLQRLSAFPNERYDDKALSYPVGRVSGEWGTIPAFESKTFPGTKKRYGWSGNSFICVVEFGQRVKAMSLLTSGESGDPSSPHFIDQQSMFAQGQFKQVLFYKEDVMAHAEKSYHPGD